MGETYFHWLTEHAESREPEKKEIDYGEIQKKFGWRVVKRISDIIGGK